MKICKSLFRGKAIYMPGEKKLLESLGTFQKLACKGLIYFAFKNLLTSNQCTKASNQRLLVLPGLPSPKP